MFFYRLRNTAYQCVFLAKKRRLKVQYICNILFFMSHNRYYISVYKFNTYYKLLDSSNINITLVCFCVFFFLSIIHNCVMHLVIFQNKILDCFVVTCPIFILKFLLIHVQNDSEIQSSIISANKSSSNSQKSECKLA